MAGESDDLDANAHFAAFLLAETQTDESEARKMSASFALRRLASSAPASTASAWTVASRRSMSGGHTKPKFEGIEATLRTYLPENHHVSGPRRRAADAHADADAVTAVLDRARRR